MDAKRRISGLSALVVAFTLSVGLTACASELIASDLARDGQTPQQGTGADDDAAPSDEVPAADPVEQEADCDWDSDRLSAAANPPEGHAGELSTVLIGAWQHTHIDEGNGFEPVEHADIRYVFPSTSEMLYCQHVPGTTDHAEQSAAITLDGTLISPPSPHKGFEVLAWDADSMVWQNNYIDGTYYLLQRR